jgi:hypothetical protein
MKGQWADFQWQPGSWPARTVLAWPGPLRRVAHGQVEHGPRPCGVRGTCARWRGIHARRRGDFTDTLGAAVLDLDGEVAVAAALTDSWGRRQEQRCSTVPVKVFVATSFVLGDDLRGGGRGEAAVGTEEDVAAWRGLPNGGDGDFGPELSNQRRGERSAMVGAEGAETMCTSAGEEVALDRGGDAVLEHGRSDGTGGRHLYGAGTARGSAAPARRRCHGAWRKVETGLRRVVPDAEGGDRQVGPTAEYFRIKNTPERK